MRIFERFCETIEISKCALKAIVEEEIRKNFEKSSFHKPQTSNSSKKHEKGKYKTEDKHFFTGFKILGSKFR